MKKLYFTVLPLFLLAYIKTSAQEFDKSASLSIFGGTLNYQGDLKPTSFTLSHASPAFGIGIKKPLSKWFTVSTGIMTGKIQAADKWNREYLKPRNLSFATTINEAFATLEITIPGIIAGKVIPYFSSGISLFHFNPYTYDRNNVKTYLQPLSTEGQGLSQYPDKKPYRLTQIALPFGFGIKYQLSDAISIGFEMSQRKTFTDYLDDVSSNYVDPNILLQERGATAVELAYRENQLPNGSPFAITGDQRGTPTEMDWYYYNGVRLDIKLNALKGLFSKQVASMKCPKF